MFSVADFSVYVAIIASLGEAGIDAVTTNLNINFLARPETRDVVASVSLIRLGRRLAVDEARLYSNGESDNGGPRDCPVRAADARWVEYYHI
jgi:acyl-coenzyme A thioesterase PaaI-like protein